MEISIRYLETDRAARPGDMKQGKKQGFAEAIGIILGCTRDEAIRFLTAQQEAIIAHEKIMA